MKRRDGGGLEEVGEKVATQSPAKKMYTHQLFDRNVRSAAGAAIATAPSRAPVTPAVSTPSTRNIVPISLVNAVRMRRGTPETNGGASPSGKVLGLDAAVAAPGAGSRLERIGCVGAAGSNIKTGSVSEYGEGDGHDSRADTKAGACKGSSCGGAAGPIIGDERFLLAESKDPQSEAVNVKAPYGSASAGWPFLMEKKAEPQAVMIGEPQRGRGAQLLPHTQALLMTAYKTAAHLRQLIEHAERVNPAADPHGLERPVSALVNFMREAHATWTERKGGAGVPATKVRGDGVMVLEGRVGTGKSTAYRTAREHMEARCANDGTLCFAMVECDEHDLREEANTRVLKAVGAESRTSENHCPLSALQRLAHVGTERPWFTVLLLKDDDGDIDTAMLAALLCIALSKTAMFAVVYMTNSSKQAHRVGELLAVDGRPDNVVSMLPYDEGHIRDILDQIFGLSGLDCLALIHDNVLAFVAKVTSERSTGLGFAFFLCLAGIMGRRMKLRSKEFTRDWEIGTGVRGRFTAESNTAAAAVLGGGGRDYMLLSVDDVRVALHEYLDIEA